MTSTQLTDDQANANNIMINFTNPGRTEFKIETKRPNIDKGIRQYPTTLSA